jgi:photosynthetic reaction center cytochrome c subunit
MRVQPTIRPATPEDADAIARLAVQLGYNSTADEAQRRLQTLNEHADHRVYVAETDGAVIAWIHLHIHPSLVTDTAAEVAGLVVDEHHRSGGVGEALMRHGEDWARAHGCSSVRLRSNVTRARAHHFYQRLGYTLWKSSHAFRKDLLSLFGVLCFTLLVCAQVPSGTKLPSVSPGTTPTPAEQVYKDIQVLKGVPAEKIMPTMQFMNIALGVQCEYCHLPGVYDAPNANKNMARTMMRMQFDLIKGTFEEIPALTCWTCHRGSAIPPTVPPLYVTVPPTASHEPQQAARVTIALQKVFEKWINAIGGPEALSKTSTQLQNGTMTAGAVKAPIEILTKSPDKRMSIVHAADGVAITAFDGHLAWQGNVGRSAHELAPEEAYGAMLQAAVTFPVAMTKLFARVRMWRPEKVNGRDTNVILGSNRGQGDVKLYFDKETGLLLRMEQIVETPIGELPAQIDYDDYRSEGGVTIPFRWTVARAQGGFTVQLDNVRQNVPIDDSRFAMPTGPVTATVAKTPAP